VNWKDCLDGDGSLDPAAVASVLYRARQAGSTLAELPSAELGLSLDDAYRVQDRMTAPRLAAGESVVGWKLGYTSAAGVAWLAEQPAARGQGLEPGDLIITGGLTRAPALEAGHRISASFGDGQWTVEVRRS
jgi:2-keto-4-pentenoate hydratase